MTLVSRLAIAGRTYSARPFIWFPDFRVLFEGRPTKFQQPGSGVDAFEGALASTAIRKLKGTIGNGD